MSFDKQQVAVYEIVQQETTSSLCSQRPVPEFSAPRPIPSAEMKDMCTVRFWQM